MSVYAIRTDEAGLIDGVRCQRCDAAWTPMVHRCPWCGGPVGEERFAADGRPWSWTTMTIPVGDLEPPTTLVYVDLQGGPRVLARWVGAPELSKDLPVRVRVEAGTVLASEEN